MPAEVAAVGAGHGEAAHAAAPAPAAHGGGVAHLSRGAELGLMALSVVIGAIGILAAWRVYVRRPEIADRLASGSPGRTAC